MQANNDTKEGPNNSIACPLSFALHMYADNRAEDRGEDVHTEREADATLVSSERAKEMATQKKHEAPEARKVPPLLLLQEKGSRGRTRSETSEGMRDKSEGTGLRD